MAPDDQLLTDENAGTGGSSAVLLEQDPVLDHSPSLVDRYQAYRRAQGRELLTVIPREGVRSLLRNFSDADRPVDDAAVLDWLAARCADLLPLPPFRDWARDFHEHREAYVDLPGPPLAPEAPDGEPVTVEVRSLPAFDDEWVAALAIRYRSNGWVGHIRFHASEASRVVSTGEIFQGGSPLEVRERFRSFDDVTLSAFLRSALP